MSERSKTVLLVSGDEELCARMRCALEKKSAGLSVIEAREPSAARTMLFEATRT